MTFNHRVVRRKNSKGHPWLAIYEVYYDDNDKPDNRTLDPVGVITEHDAPKGIKEMRETLERMLKCLDQPILDDEKHFKED